jgi:hypothetical protein
MYVEKRGEILEELLHIFLQDSDRDALEITFIYATKCYQIALLSILL